MPPLSPESLTLQSAAVPVAVVAWGAVVGLGKANPRAVGPAWWAAALGGTALSIALLPWAAATAPLPAVLQAVLGFGAVLAALEGVLRFRAWPGEARRWRFELLALCLVAALAWPWPAGMTWPDRALDGAHALALCALAWAAARGTSAADRPGLWLSAAFAVLFGVAYAWRAWEGGVATVGAPGWWLQALLLFCVGWPLGLLLACFGRAHARVQALATQDLLTSLANGRQFEAQLAALAQQASGGGAPFGLVAFDLEGVKEVNVLLGRDAGDAMLAEFGRRLRRALRHGDVPARSGGHEFAALLLGVPDAQTLQPLIQRVLGTVQGPLQWRGHALELRCRHGAACWSEAQGRLDDLRALTDRRLRAAPAAQRDGPWVNPLPTPPRPPSTRSRASDQG